MTPKTTPFSLFFCNFSHKNWYFLEDRWSTKTHFFGVFLGFIAMNLIFNRIFFPDEIEAGSPKLGGGYYQLKSDLDWGGVLFGGRV